MTNRTKLLRGSWVIAWLVLGCPLAGEDPLAEGKRALAEGRLGKAEQLLTGIHDDARRCEAGFYLGLTRYRQKQLDQAIIDLESAAQCDPARGEAWSALGAAWLAKGDDGRALGAFESALRIQPGNAEALRAAGAIELRHDRNEQAAQILEKLVAAEPRDGQAHADLGAAYAAMARYEQAREQFALALTLRPGHISALAGLGNLELKTGQPAAALALLDRAVAIDPAAYEPRFLRAAAYNALGRYADAIAECRQAIRLGGRDAEIYYHLAKALRALGREQESREALAQFSSLRSQSKQAEEARREAGRLLERAKPLVETGDLAGASALLERAARLDPANPALLFRLAGLYYDQRRFDLARYYVDRAILLAPSEWLYHYLLGMIEKASGRLDAARASLATAAQLNPSAAEVFNELGDVAMRRQELSEAVRHFEQASRLQPQEPAYRLNLEAARRRLMSRD